MLKSLLKKQLLEMNASLFISRKTGKRRNIGGIIGYCILMLFVYVSLLAMFSSVGFMLSEMLYLGDDLSWIFYAMTAILSIMMGVFGSIFNTYVSLYKAKDNELLLSMPIKPSVILTARIFGVFLSALLFTSVAWLPPVIVSWIMLKPTASMVVFSLLMLPVMTLFVTVLSCILGWVVALVSGRFKNKNFITVIVSLAAFAAYYYVVLNMNELLGKLVANSAQFGSVIKAKLFFIYEIARSAQGDALAALIVSAITIALFVVCCYILSRSFISITTRSSGEKKAVYKQQELKAQDYSKALFMRELKHLSSSSVFMMNSGIGLLIAPVLGIVALLKKADIANYLLLISELEPSLMALIPAIVIGTAIMLVSMNNFTAPSISLEGNTLWIIKSLPVSTKDILNAKAKLHIVLNTVPVLFLTVCLSITLGLDIADMALVCACVWMYIVLSAYLGLALNILRPSFNWSSEAFPVKQSLPIAVMIFGGWIIGIAVVAAAYFLRNLLGAQAIITVILAVLIVAYRLLYRWLITKGAERFEKL